MKLTKKGVTKAYKLYLSGLSLRKVGKKYDISGEAVRQRFEKEGLQTRKKKEAMKYRIPKYMKTGIKKCSSCGKRYTLDNFYRQTNKYLQFWCKKCQTEYNREWYKNRYANDAEYRKKEQKRKREWKIKNRERYNEYMRKYNKTEKAKEYIKKNRKRINTYHKKWRDDNIEHARKYQREYKKKKA